MAMNLSKWRAAPLAVLAAFMLCGCEDGEKAAATADAALRQALEETKAIPDPMLALTTLQNREVATSKANNPCYTPVYENRVICVAVPARQVVAEQKVRLLSQAIDRADRRAFSFLYSKRLDAEDEFAALRIASVPKLLAYADKALGEPQDARLLAVAAQFAAEGNLTIRDTYKAVNYYARAWGAGYAQAADGAALLFLSINDVRNAYLWSLRCTVECRRTSDYPKSVTLEALQQRLSPEAVKQAQALAASPSVVEIDTRGG